MLRRFQISGTQLFNLKLIGGGGRRRVLKTKCSFLGSAAAFSSRSTSTGINLSFQSKSIDPNNVPDIKSNSPLSGLEGAMMDYILGNNKATQVAQSVWEHVIQKGDAVVDATCGNGYDTLAMVKMVAKKSHTGRVYAMDIQETALKNTMSLFNKSLDPDEREIVKLFANCHSKMEDVVPRDIAVRLVVFNLGYLPGGDKTIITKSETTFLGMEAASRILAPGGLISMMVYVGHRGGMEEFERVEAFASGLPNDNWVCCKLQMLNRPLAPVLFLLCKRWKEHDTFQRD